MIPSDTKSDEIAAVAEVFGPGGLLERKSRGYEPRAGQIRMAEAVAQAIAQKSHLAVEAPCGTGKTYAYLVPAIAHAQETNGRVIVCTANIALQEQIVEKDLPVLARLLPRKFTYALIKGINNYLCLYRFDETREDLTRVTFNAKEARHWNKLVAWRNETRTGDVSDLDFEPAETVWNRVNGVSDLCNASECRHYGECFAMDARRRLRGAQVIVTNYHLFFAHLRVRAAGAGDVILPSAEVVICDEAHDMADIARDFFGARLAPGSIYTLTRGAYALDRRSLADRLRSASRTFFARVAAHPERRLTKPRWIEPGDILEAAEDYAAELREARRTIEDEDQLDVLSKYAGAADRYVATLRSFLSLNDPNTVAWIERGDQTARLQARAIDVSAILSEHLFKATPTVILTSATLTAGGNFHFLKRETGAESARELEVPSPFDYRNQAIVVLPSMKCDPNAPGFAAEMSAHLNRIIRGLGGRTMCLFTSYRNLQACADAAESTGIKILRQGDAPRSKLLKQFRRDEGTALFATSSFWQGVDIPGEALSCLTIDKIPFLNPDDPLLEALSARDPQSFMNYSLPKAILDLRQGFGRLIRTSHDRGVVVLFDNRLLRKMYGREVLSSLPPCPIRTDLEDLERFFSNAEEPIE